MIKHRFNNIPNTIIIVGCGGTGSRLVPLVAQFLKTCPWVLNPAIFLVDDDVVEEKNLARQNFIRMDVGKKKAEVLANRYSKAYDINIIPIPARIGSLEDPHPNYDSVGRGNVFSSIFGADVVVRGNHKSAMVISCVDTMKARRAILSEFTRLWYDNAIFLDGGNEDIFGQVMVSCPKYILYTDSHTTKPFELDHNVDSNLKGLVPFEAESGYPIPIDLNFYLNTADQVGTRSCADLDQTMAINSLIANNMFAVIQNIFYSKWFNYNRINISLNSSVPEFLTPRKLHSLVVYRPTYDKLYGTRSIMLSTEAGFKKAVTTASYTELRDMSRSEFMLMYLSDFLSPLAIAVEKDIKQKALEARKKAEEEARKKAEEEARKKAEEEAKQVGIENAKKAESIFKKKSATFKEVKIDGDKEVPLVIPPPLVSPDGIIATPIPTGNIQSASAA